MRTSRSVGALLLWLVWLIAGCSSTETRPNPAERTSPSNGGGEAAEVSGEASTTEASPEVEALEGEVSGEFNWLMLHDVQGLFGGRALFLLPDGSMVVQWVEPGQPHGLQERRFVGTVDTGAHERIAELLVEEDFRAMEVPERPGIPDEARAVLAVGFQDGSVKVLGKWSGVDHAPFSLLYRHLMGLAEALETGRPTQVGVFDYGWRPDGVSWPPLR